MTHIITMKRKIFLHTIQAAITRLILNSHAIRLHHLTGNSRYFEMNRLISNDRHFRNILLIRNRHLMICRLR